MKVDATAGVARVIFANTQYLGIEYNAKIGDVITIESGVTEILIYNAAESGPLTFDLSFSSAATVMASAAAIASTLLLTSF